MAAYKLTAGFPRREMFGITSQVRRASASVAANIAQGFGRRTTRELLRSVESAAGEMEETRYFLILSRDLGYLGGLRSSIGALGFGRPADQSAGAFFESAAERTVASTSHKSEVTSHGDIHGS